VSHFFINLDCSHLQNYTFLNIQLYYNKKMKKIKIR
jgi:hypothetical protein